MGNTTKNRRDRSPAIFSWPLAPGRYANDMIPDLSPTPTTSPIRVDGVADRFEWVDGVADMEMEEGPANAGPSSMIFASIYIDTRPVWRSYARTLTTAGRCLRAVPGCVCT
jgi:hypothetical protein